LNLDLIDIGSNLTHESFASDRDAVMDRASQAGVRRQIVTGADLNSSFQAAALAAAHPRRLWSTAGVHPHHAQGFTEAQHTELAAQLQRYPIVAVGECGLDYCRNLSPPADQRAAFRVQLALAAQLHKPVFLHQRDAQSDFMAVLEEYRGQLVGGVAHCFTGGVAELERYIEYGLHIGVTGWVCDERRGLELRQAVPRIPADRLLIETDAPYLLPRDLSPRPKSRRNEPSFLPHIAAAVAQLRGESVEAVGAQTTRNAVALFALTDS
jgi:TatD DNase family protein